jgi:predicted short-subunit dehydrogenase-like oxidoreductase (DUF2520 family)
MIAIVGGGRMGRGLASALSEAGEQISLWSRREATGAVSAAVSGATTIVVAVPDGAITPVATELASAGAVDAEQVVLHLSGLLDAGALRPLAGTGAALGSWHPLQTISDTATAAERWRGAVAAVEGDPRAIAEARRLSQLLGLEPIGLPPGAKPAYHAGAVMASNYVVALAAMAGRVAAAAGIPPELAARMYLPLLLGTAENLAHASPAVALTGPVRRGDVATVRVHLEALAPEDRRLYARLGLETLAVARAGGLLDPARGEAMERLFRDY